MKKSQFLLSTLGVSAIALSAFFVQSKVATNPDYLSLKAAKYADESNEGQEIAGALEYLKMMRGNQITGEVNPMDVQAAKDQANVMLKFDKKSRASFSTINWSETGPNNIGGRCRALVVDKNNSNKLYIGSSGGGLWTSTDNGDNWTKRNGNDSASAIAVCAIAQAANGDLYYGTGEGFGAGIGYTNGAQTQLGEGIFKSTDGGNSFSQLAATKPSSSNSSSDQWSFVQRIIAHPTDANRLIAATGSGLKVTNNGGTTWAKPASLTSNAFFADVDQSTDGNRVVAATNSAIYISNDGGNTFGASIMGLNGMPASAGLGRIDIAIAPSNADYLYACIATSGSTLKGIYKSTDGGLNWTTIGIGGSAIFDPLGSQGFWNIAFGVHPTNPDMVFLGGQLDLFRYTPATTWVAIANWVGSAFNGTLVHADMHGIYFNPSDANTMYVVNDGGFYRTSNCADANPFFAERNKFLNVTQCYGVAANTLGQIVYGAQDNGSGIIGTSANSPLQSKELTGGDGMRGAISSLNPKVMFTTQYGGVLYRATDGGANSLSFKSFFDKNVDANADGDPEEGAIWVAPILLKEKVNSDGEPRSAFLLGTNSSVWMTQGAISSKATWFQLAYSSNVGFSALTIPSENNKIVYAATSGGALYRIDVPDLIDSTYKYIDSVENTGTQVYANLITKTLIGNFSGRYITDVATDKTGRNVVVTLGNYGNTAYVYKSSKADTASNTSNAGFTDVTGALPKMPVYSAVFVGGDATKLLVGTELGVWGSEVVNGTLWAEMNMNSTDPTKWHPRAATYEIIELGSLKSADGSGYAGPVIYTGTHGRGTYRSTSLANYWPTAINTVNENTEKISVYPNPASSSASISYNTENAGTATIKIYSITGSLVKAYTSKVNVGDNTISLNLSDIANGGYIIYVSNGTKKASAKLIKQ